MSNISENFMHLDYPQRLIQPIFFLIINKLQFGFPKNPFHDIIIISDIFK